MSFRFISHQGRTGCIVRTSHSHSGHTPGEKSENKKNPVLPDVEDFVMERLSLGRTPVQVSLDTRNRAKKLGFKDASDARVFVTPLGVRRIAQRRKMEYRIHSSDAVSVDVLCTETLKDKIKLYQPMTEENPLLIVYQNDEQFTWLQKYGNNMVFCDASYKGLTQYGYAVYTISVRNSSGKG